MRPGMQAKDIDVYRSFIVAPPSSAFAQLLSVVGQLKPGVDITAARADVSAVLRRSTNPGRGETVVTNHLEPLAALLVRGARTSLNVLLAAVMFVLLVACTNIANLLLARATVRQKEMAVRTSVGAGWTRVLRQFLAESVLYSVVGGSTGFLLARSLLRAIVNIYPQAVPRLAESAIHGSVIAAMIGVLVITTVIFGLIPVFAAGRSNIHGILKEGSQTVSATRRRVRARTILAGTQVALAVALLAGAGLMLKSFWHMTDRPAGFQPERVLTMRLDFAPRSTGSAKVEYANRLIARLKSVPVIDAVSVNTHGDSLTNFTVEGEPPSPPGTATAPIYMNQTSADFAKVMGLFLLKGRWFTDEESQPVIVLNESLARLKFGRDDPIGRRIECPAIGQPLLTDTFDPIPIPTTATIIGVVSDLRYTKLDDVSAPEFYVPYRKTRSMFRLSLVLKTAADPLTVVPALSTAIGTEDKTQKPYDITTLDRFLNESIAPRRLNLVVLLTFAGTAMLLALIGIYGVMSYSVSQRTHEIGIRSALGASRADVVGMVVWQGVRVAAAGIVVGVASALMLTHVMSSLLFEVEPTDPPTLAIAAMMLALAAVMASAVPALRAGAVDPLVALRCE
jgi:putative ABC transport system permease protein